MDSWIFFILFVEFKDQRGKKQLIRFDASWVLGLKRRHFVQIRKRLFFVNYFTTFDIGWLWFKQVYNQCVLSWDQRTSNDGHGVMIITLQAVRSVIRLWNRPWSRISRCRRSTRRKSGRSIELNYGISNPFQPEYGHRWLVSLNFRLNGYNWYYLYCLTLRNK